MRAPALAAMVAVAAGGGVAAGCGDDDAGRPSTTAARSAAPSVTVAAAGTTVGVAVARGAGGRPCLRISQRSSSGDAYSGVDSGSCAAKGERLGPFALTWPGTRRAAVVDFPASGCGRWRLVTHDPTRVAVCAPGTPGVHAMVFRGGRRVTLDDGTRRRSVDLRRACPADQAVCLDDL